MMWVALAAAVMVGCAQQPKYTISGQVEGVEMLYLTNNDGVIDSAKVDNGAFLFEGTVAEPRWLILPMLRMCVPHRYVRSALWRRVQ